MVDISHGGSAKIPRRIAATTLLCASFILGTTVWSEESQPESFALVELFTSEGCSSCPPADRLLGMILSAARRDKERLFPLAFHVDTWNHLGWVDPFSDPAYSRRQEEYARAFHLKAPYTPQMVVNGVDEFVGSNMWRARGGLTKAMKTPARAAVVLRLQPAKAPDALLVDYKVAGAPANALVHIALVERGVMSKVLKGENAGRALRHENVVRIFKTVPLGAQAEGEVELKLPSTFVRRNLSVIGYVQDPTTLAIVGAEGAELMI